MAFEQRPEGSGGVRLVDLLGKSLQAEGSATAEAKTVPSMLAK